MKKSIFESMLMLLAMGLSFASCSSDDETTVVPTAPLQVVLEMPMNLENPTLQSAVATLVNVQTNAEYKITSFQPQATTKAAEAADTYVGEIEVPVGSYNVNVEGTVSYLIDGTTATTGISASYTTTVAENATGGNSVKVAMNVYNAAQGFVIEEIYYTTSLNAAGTNGYALDGYVKITNNSDQVLYADSLAFLEGAFLTSQKYEYTPDVMSQAFSVDNIYMIPGTGKDVPVQPGKSLVLAINGTDHSQILEGAIDLSGADYEFYDVSSNASTDTDYPEVANLDKWYSSTLSFFTLHNQGYAAYAIAKMRGDKETFLTDYKYDATYLFVFGDFSKEMSKANLYKIPNSWIVDAVNTGVEAAFQWIVTDPSLDKSYAYCSTVASDKTRFGKAIIRKSANGKLVDTNDSANDFQHGVTPSLKK